MENYGNFICTIYIIRYYKVTFIIIFGCTDFMLGRLDLKWVGGALHQIFGTRVQHVKKIGPNRI